MTKTTDKQAAIAALKAALDELHVTTGPLGTGYDAKGDVIASALGNARRLLSALEADDGRALLRQLREHVAEWERLHQQAVGDPTVDQRVLQGYLAIERDVMDKIDRLLAAEPAQSAEPAAPALTELLEKAKDYKMTPEEREEQRQSFARGNMMPEDRKTMPMRTPSDAAPAVDYYEDHMFHTPDGLPSSRCHECGVVYKEAGFVPCKPDAAAPAGDDEARIAEWDGENVGHGRDSAEVRRTGATLMREFLARAVKAEGVLRAIDEVIADRGVPERDCTLPLPQRVDNLIVELKNWRHSYGEAALLAEKAETEIRHLRAKLAESEAEVADLRLFHVQDSDRPMYVLAKDWSHAIDAWWRVVRAENPEVGAEELEDPDGVSLIASGNEVLIDVRQPPKAPR